MISCHVVYLVQESGLTVNTKLATASGNVEGSIAALQENIENGISVESSRRALRVLLRSQAGYQ